MFYRQTKGMEWKLLRMMQAASRVPTKCICRWENRHSVMALQVGRCHARSEVYIKAKQYRF